MRLKQDLYWLNSDLWWKLECKIPPFFPSVTPKTCQQANSLSFGLTREAWKRQLSHFLNQNVLRCPVLVQDLSDLRSIPWSEAQQVSGALPYPPSPLPPRLFFCATMNSLYNACLIHQNTCTRVPLHWVPLQQWAPFSGRPALHCFPLGARGQAFFCRHIQ